MPLLLTTPLDMGAVDSDYTHVKITTLLHTETFIHLTVQHGTMDGETFVVGRDITNVTSKRFAIEGAEYTSIVSTLTSAQGVPVYDEVADALYQWLINQGHYSGTVV